MRRPLALLTSVRASLLLVIGLLGVPAARAGSVPARDTARAGARTVVLDGVSVRLRRGTTQTITVRHTHGWHARVTLWSRNRQGAEAGQWRRVRASSEARTGYGGLVVGKRRRQGTGTTPLGTWRLTSTFGTQQRRSDWSMQHRRIRSGDFWVQDNASRHDNTYRNQRAGGFRRWLPTSHPESSERLSDCGRVYEHVVVLDYNAEQVRRRGSGTFLHVNGSGATAGCVSAPRGWMRAALRRLDPDRAP